MREKLEENGEKSCSLSYILSKLYLKVRIFIISSFQSGKGVQSFSFSLRKERTYFLLVPQTYIGKKISVSYKV